MLNIKRLAKFPKAVTLVTATITCVGLVTSNPVMAAILTFPFCGFFFGDTSGNSGQVLPGSFITLDTDKKTASENFGFIGAQITTTRGPSPTDAPLIYTTSNFTNVLEGNFIPEGIPEGSEILPLPEDSAIWRLLDSDGNRFYVGLRKSTFNLLPNYNDTIFWDNYECRVNEDNCRREPDPNPVPEPTSIFGTMFVFGLGGLLSKKRLKKLKKDNELA
jgi:hypothetical protein